jgi:predicted transcriptional regulator YdeE
MDEMANGIFILPDENRLALDDALSNYEFNTLLKVVRQYESWKKTGEFTLTHTIAQELWQSLLEKDNPNKIYGPLEVYDAITREIARRIADQ